MNQNIKSTPEIQPDLQLLGNHLRCTNSRCECQRDRKSSLKLHCPAHGDEHPSLSVTQKPGKVLVNCLEGCSQHAVI